LFIINKKLFISKLKRRRNRFKRLRSKHISALFLSRKKRFDNYYQLFDSKLVKKNKMFNNSILKKNSKKSKKFTIGLTSKENDLIEIKSLKSLRFCMHRYLKSMKMYKRKLKTKIAVFPNYWLTNKPKSVRMGKGKGSLTKKISFLKKGEYLFNIKILKKYLNYKLNKKLYFFKFSIFINILLKNLKSKTTAKTNIYKH